MQSTAHDPCTEQHQENGQTTQATLWPAPRHAPILTSIRKQLSPLGGGTKGTCFCSRTPLLQQGPNKALPEFLVWALVDFY